MPQTTKIESRYCKLREKEVKVLLEAIREQGNPNILSWDIKKCLNKEEACFNTGCSFTEIGGKNPF